VKRLFGTDGIRAVAGEPPLDPETVRCFGVALAEVLRAGSKSGRVVLGRDTRESGSWLTDAVAAGLGSRAIDGVDAGVISTPGLAHIVRSCGFDAGVMISASHNPFQDNGLKAFGADGAKLPDSLEQRIEALLLDHGVADPGAGGPRAAADATLLARYVDRLETVLPASRLRGLRVVADCANGAACAFAPRVLEHYGAVVDAIGIEPNGRNINLGCGSLHLAALAERVRATRADVGLAFDGDADRCLAVDAQGRVVDGDHILFVTGTRLKRSGHLRGDALVATIMSNFWLEERLGREGVRLHRAPVGDKYVLEKMVAEDLVLGGEQSGHVIFREFATTGDGVLTGLLLLDAVVDGPSLDAILDDIRPYPQEIVNVRVRAKPDLRAHPRIGPVVRRVETALDGCGRVVLRYSGTEPLARVMIEGQDATSVRRLVTELARVIEEELG